MEFYLSIEGKKEGPFSMFKVGEMISDGIVDGDTLGWHRDMTEWKPIREIAALQGLLAPKLPPKEPAPPPEEKPRETELPPGEVIALEPALPREVRPFSRFWARMFDLMLVVTIVHMTFEFPQWEPRPDESLADAIARMIESYQSEEMAVMSRTAFLALICWHILEAMLLHFFGTTPGKAIFGIRVTDPDGGRLSPLRSLGRSLYVYVLGVGLYLFPLILIGMVFSFFRILGSGQCVWDQHLKIRVETSPMSVVRIVLAFAAFFGLLFLQSLKLS